MDLTILGFLCLFVLFFGQNSLKEFVKTSHNTILIPP